jgi:hypothetical protein
VLRASVFRHPEGLRNCGIIDLPHGLCKNIHRAEAPAAEVVQEARAFARNLAPLCNFRLSGQISACVMSGGLL